MPVINENTPGDKDVDIYVKEGVGGQGSGYKLKSDLGKTVLGRLEDYGPKGFFGDGSKGIIQRIYNDFNPTVSSNFIDDLQNVVTEFMINNGYSVGISDLIADNDTYEKIVISSDISNEGEDAGRRSRGRHCQHVAR